MTTEPYPTVPTDNLGPFITALRIYMGMGQRAAARKLDIDRRRYQRIEAGAVPCPTGFVTRVVELVAEFDAAVDAVLAATEDTTIDIGVTAGFSEEWDRQIAYRAAVESCYTDGGIITAAPRITLTLVG